MKERPILFSAPMVRAILEGRKTQTRRIVKFDVAPNSPHILDFYRNGQWRGALDATTRKGNALQLCPYGVPGDLLNVKESAWMWCERVPNGVTRTGRPKWHYVPMRVAPVHYAAKRPKKPGTDIVSPDTGNQWGWRLKIGRFLPAWASRITLRITDVRVERLQDISEADAMAEGVPFTDLPQGRSKPDPLHRAQFADLWESINGPESWRANPWVWAVSFERIKQARAAA